MRSNLLDIPFDHYQRYAPAAALLAAIGPIDGTVLEVGANEQRLLSSFLPEVKFVFSDLFAQANVDEAFVRADATKLPFADGYFEASVCLDVLEHMPRAKRIVAVKEMVRVSKRLVIIACPPDRSWVKQAEEDADKVWKDYFGSSYPWLEEHHQFGLVSPEDIECALREAGMRVVRFSQGDPALWATLMSAHFIKEAVGEFRSLVSAMDSLYNRVLFPFDRSDAGYRDFFVAVASEHDEHKVAEPPHAPANMQIAVKGFLSGIAGMLRPVVDRVRFAEQQWQETARLLGQAEKGQGIATEGWKSTVDRLYETERMLGESKGLLAESEHRLTMLGLRLEEKESELSRSQSELGIEQEKIVNLQQELHVEHREYADALNRERMLGIRLGRARIVAGLLGFLLALTTLICIFKK